jgi:hypothetical protein
LLSEAQRSEHLEAGAPFAQIALGDLLAKQDAELGVPLEGKLAKCKHVQQHT